MNDMWAMIVLGLLSFFCREKQRKSTSNKLNAELFYQDKWHLFPLMIIWPEASGKAFISTPAYLTLWDFTKNMANFFYEIDESFLRFFSLTLVLVDSILPLDV